MQNQPPLENLSQAHFERAVLQAVEPVLVVFWSPWSRPCQVITSELEGLAAEAGTHCRIFRVNVDDNPDLGVVYDITSVPTMLWFLGGQVRARIIGTASKQAILSKLETLLGDSPNHLNAPKDAKP